MTEQAQRFDCQGDTLIGILHRPDRPNGRGVVVVVGGGPQYRAGGHRQLVLWSRKLCDHGYAVLRFDYRGMGDSQGCFAGFLAVDEDIRCAVDHLVAEVPDLDDVVLWGECDAASAILLYAGLDERVTGAVLLNPWVRSEALQARTVLRHYYLNRLLQPSFWRKLIGGSFNPIESIRSWLALRRAARSSGARSGTSQSQALAPRAPVPRDLPLAESMLVGLQRFRGSLMLVMSGRDLIAREFDDLVSASPDWQAALARSKAVRHDLPDGDHTFSSARQRGQVVEWALQWLRQ